jgi:rhamnose transport system permease protein
MRLEGYTVNLINIVIGALLVLSVISTSFLAWVSALTSGRGGTGLSGTFRRRRQAVADSSSSNEKE